MCMCSDLTQILRHQHSGRSMLEDMLCLMRAHVGSPPHIYISCIDILNSMLQDPILREGALRAIPPDLPENGTSGGSQALLAITGLVNSQYPFRLLEADHTCDCPGSPALLEPPATREPRG
jgi:hypothetical protein